MQIEISGIKIDVRKKKIKNLNIAVAPPNGEVRVSAPMHLSDEIIENILVTKIGWIQKQQEKFKSRPRAAEPQYVSGEILYVFGQPYVLRVEEGKKKNSLWLSGNEAILTVRKESTLIQRKAIVCEWYRAQLKEKIELYLPKWEEFTGLYCSSWQVKSMTTRWGTCNTKTRKIWLNLRLAAKPVDCLEYVILHELAHLKVPNHGRDFVAIMDKFMPNWAQTKKLLNGFDVGDISEKNG